MIRIRARDNETGEPVIILGLSFANLSKLQQGKPMLVMCSDIEIPIQIAIVAGETEGAIIRDLIEAGLLPKETAGRARAGERREWRNPDFPPQNEEATGW